MTRLLEILIKFSFEMVLYLPSLPKTHLGNLCFHPCNFGLCEAKGADLQRGNSLTRGTSSTHKL